MAPGRSTRRANVVALACALLPALTAPEGVRADDPPAAPTLIGDLYPHPRPWGSSPNSFVRVGDQVFFSAHTVLSSEELWRTDGTAEGTWLVKDIAPGLDFADPHGRAVGDELFFSAKDPDAGRELWRSDGTAEGTSRIADLRPGPESLDPAVLAAAGDMAFFSVDLGGPPRELWWSEGSEAGTRRIEAAPNPLYPWPQFELVRVGPFVYFAAADASHGRELWRTDGTEEGTALVRDIVPGPAGSHPRELAAWGERLVFTACDEAGCEPWTSDGTENGTSRYADLVPGPLSSDPKTFVSDGVRLVFEAGSPEFGREVWWVPEPDHGAAGIVALLVLASLRWRRVDSTL